MTEQLPLNLRDYGVCVPEATANRWLPIIQQERAALAHGCPRPKWRELRDVATDMNAKGVNIPTISQIFNWPATGSRYHQVRALENLLPCVMEWADRTSGLSLATLVKIARKKGEAQMAEMHAVKATRRA